MKIAVEDDPELSDNTQIVFAVQVAGLSLDESRAARRQWNEVMLSVFQPTRKLLFCLLLELKSSWKETNSVRRLLKDACTRKLPLQYSRQGSNLQPRL